MKSPHEYQRKVLFKNKEIEVIEIVWPIGSSTPFHDHGNSHGIIKVMEGIMLEEVYSKRSKEHLRTQTYGPGDVIFEFPDIIHRMSNTLNNRRARTIHSYIPLLVMKEYNLKTKGDSK